MKLPRHIGKIAGIVIILAMWVYIMLTNTDGKPAKAIAWMLLIVLFVFSGYRRHYHVYVLEKLQKLHDHEDYVKYFDAMTFSVGAFKNFVVLTPYLKTFKSHEENEARLKINRMTYLLYLSVIGIGLLEIIFK
jgi:hypothetical protein